ncbi:MAG: hypothetical protein GXP50_07325 [Deltaproteobacteria bacterium]|nr:hypothetical protein [Deltaproteobacteria bacterium]
MGRRPDLGTSHGRWAAAAGSAPGLFSLLERGTWKELGRRPGRITFRVETPRGPLFAKHYAPASGPGLGRTPHRAFARARLLHAAGVSTPAPLGLYLRGRLWPREAVLVTEWLEEVVPWARFLQNVPPERENGAAAVGALVAHLHRLGWVHSSLTEHLVFARHREGHRPFLLGTEGVIRPSTRRRRVANLAELAREVSLEALGLRERWGGLRAYGAVLGLEREAVRRLWREARRAAE